MTYKRTNIYLNVEEKEELLKIITPKGVNLSWFIRYLIREYLKENK
jgi:hypothetical protein